MLKRLWFAAVAIGLLSLGAIAPAHAEHSPEQQLQLKNIYRSEGYVVDFDAERGLPDRILNARINTAQRRGAVGTPEEVSADFLREHAELLFGTDEVRIDALARSGGSFELRTIRVRSSLSGTQVIRQQYSNGLPIDGASVQVNIDKTGGVMSAISSVRPNAVILDPQPAISPQDAVAALLAAVDQPGEMRAEPKVELVGWPNAGVTTLVFKTEVPLWSPYSDQLAYVDANSGQVLAQTDLMIHCNHKRPGAPVGRIDITPPAETPEHEHFLARRVDGSGDVLPSNPLDGEPSRYGLRDGDPVAGFVENKVLPRLDGSGFLRGDYVDASNSSIARANEPSLVFNYSPDIADGHFHEVNVYWHIDTMQDYIQSTLGFNNVVNRQQIAAAHEGEDDNSSYSPSTLRVRFGDGGVDDSEDGEVVLHEYGHAIHDDISGIGGGEAGAISEGFGDYVAASFSQNPIVAEWDATSYNPGPPPNLRRTDGTKHYPEDLVGQVHADGEIISAAWWELNTLLGREIADKLTFESFFLVGATTTMTEMADAYVQADQAIYGGAHLGTIFSVFGGRGMGPAYLLEISHSPLTDTEDSSGPYSVVASILHTSPITGANAVQMSWRVAGDPSFTTVTMNDDGGDQWSASIPGPGADATIEYYISAVDDQAVSTTLPLNAPTNVLSFNVGTDLVPPVLSHNALGDQPLLVWPAEVRATATDNLGLASVVVDYSLNGNPQGSFPLFVAGGDNFAADFPIPAGSLVFGDMIEYSITATDASSAANSVSVGPYSFEIIDAKGVVLIIDDDDSAKGGGTKFTGDKVEVTDVDRDPAKVGAAATQMAAALTATGYVVTVEPVATTDPSTWSSYSVVIASSGSNTAPMADAAYRAALVAYAQSGGKLMVEGGEVAYDAASSPGYAEIVSDVIHAFDWDADNAGSLVEVASQATHPIRTSPHALPATIDIAYGAFGDNDAVKPNPEAYIVYGTTSYPANAGVLVYDDNLAPQSAQIVFCAFAMDKVADPATADALVENIIEFLLAEESGATASLSGQVSLEGSGPAEGISVSIGTASTTTDASGNYTFTDLFEGTYIVTAEGPAGFATATQTVALANGEARTGVDFLLRAIVTTETTCNQVAQAIPDNNPAGVVSSIFVGDAAEIVSVTVSVDITHTWRGDLIVEITSPAGTTVRLHNRTGSSADDLIATYSGLVQFAGESSNGTWNLLVSDNAGADVGQLNEWCISAEVIEFGSVATLVSNFGARNVQEGIELRWDLENAAGLRGFEVQRSVNGETRMATESPLEVKDGAGVFVDRVTGLENGTQVGYRLVGVFADGRTELISGETTVLYQRSLPTRLTLEQNLPNPFNPSTKIFFAVPTNGRVTLRIYDLAGRLVNELVNGELQAGTHEVVWDGRDNGGRSVASGSYLYRIQSNDQVQTKRMVLLK